MVEPPLTIEEVARLIAKPLPPPEWVIPVLKHFGELVGGPPPSDDDTVERNLFRYAKYLDDWLPMYADAYVKLGIEDDIPECIETILLHLPDLLKILSKDVLDKGTGNSQRRVCAAVCAEIWRTLHGAIQPHSRHLQEACDAYWRERGQEPRSLTNDPRVWLRDLQWVVAVGHADTQLVRSQIEQFRHQLSHTKPPPK